MGQSAPWCGIGETAASPAGSGGGGCSGYFWCPTDRRERYRGPYKDQTLLAVVAAGRVSIRGAKASRKARQSRPKGWTSTRGHRRGTPANIGSDTAGATARSAVISEPPPRNIPCNLQLLTRLMPPKDARGRRGLVEGDGPVHAWRSQALRLAYFHRWLLALRGAAAGPSATSNTNPGRGSQRRTHLARVRRGAGRAREIRAMGWWWGAVGSLTG